MSLVEIFGKTDLAPIGVALVEKICVAIGAISKPHRTIRDAEAELEAEKIKAVGQIEIQAARRRAVERLLSETMTEQEYLESIYGKT
jgi:hypothetical protein